MGTSANKHLLQGQLNIQNFFIQTIQHAMILSIHTPLDFHTFKSKAKTVHLEASDELGLFSNLSKKADKHAIKQHKESWIWRPKDKKKPTILGRLLKKTMTSTSSSSKRSILLPASLTREHTLDAKLR